jgi:Fe-Mn family superoxide dismutase
MKLIHTLPTLPYDYGDLSPYISEDTMKLHHDKHHKKYADELNKLIDQKEEMHELDIENLLKHLSLVLDGSEGIEKIKNNAGGFYNHSIWWPMLTPKKNSLPSSMMENHIKSNFNSLEEMKNKFSSSALSLFGSGWCWISMNGSNMDIVCTKDQSNPILEKKGFPILGLDLWEHSYYLDYQNRRKEYIESFWKIVNWKEVENRFLQAESWNRN